MNKIVIMSIFIIATLNLSGCATSINPTGRLVSALGDDFRSIEMTSPANESSKAKSGLCFAANTEKTFSALRDNSIFQTLKSNSLGFKMIQPNKNEKLELDKFVLDISFWHPGGFGGRGGFLAIIDELSNDLLKQIETEQAGDQELKKMLHHYMKAYIEGEFVLRNGLKLPKPSGSIKKQDDGMITASIDNKAVTGLTTVILEALFDHCLETSVYHSDQKKLTYKPIYEENEPKTSKKFHIAYYEQKESDDYLFGEGNNNTPTFIDSGFGKAKSIEICDKECLDPKKGMTKENLLAIRRFSDLDAEISKLAAGSAFKSIGGLGISFFGLLKFSVGDNDNLNHIVETLASVVTKRETEYILYKLIEGKNCGNRNCENLQAFLMNMDFVKNDIKN